MSWRSWPGKKNVAGETHPAAWHMLDVAAVARLLVPAGPLGHLPEAVQEALVFLIALHDLGKMSEAFRRQLLDGVPASDRLRHWRLTADALQGLDGTLADHIAGTIGVRHVLVQTVAGHHGRPPGGGTSRRERMEIARALSDEAMSDARVFIEAVAELFPQASLEGVGEPLARRLSWTLAGVASICDWVGSNSGWFPFADSHIPLLDYWDSVQRRGAKAVREAGLLAASPARPTPAALAGGQPLRPMQRAAAEVPLPARPILALIEDATGAGKTEAALILAQRLIAAGHAKGLYFALPTMATADAMFARLREAVRLMFRCRPSLALVHGRRELSRDFAALRGADGAHPEDAGIAAWIADDRRKAFLAEVGVGTIDQALLGVMPTRYNTMRLAGLADHVLIVDEAHAYEPYTEAALTMLLRAQAMAGGSAIVMTATLPRTLRDGLVAAFAEELEMAPPALSDAYPALTVIGRSGPGHHSPVDPVSATVRDVAVERLETSEAAIHCIEQARRQGAACVWVRNAVDEAITAAEALRARGVPAQLLHARFALADRHTIEAEVLSRFGRDRASGQGAVLVATQVVEASLDLDFDVMVSDLAPIGALIQRAGRLWRHMDRRPAETRPTPGPRLHVLAPDPNAVAAPDWLRPVLGQGAWVYPVADQWRTARALFACGAIRAPDGLRALIEAVHGPDAPEVPEVLQEAEMAATGGSAAERAQAWRNVIALADGYPAMPDPADDRIYPTRLGEDQITLVLAHRMADGFAFWADDPDPRRAEALSEVRLARRKWEARGAPCDTAAELALSRHWKDWERATKAILSVDANGHIMEGLEYDAARGLVMEVKT